MVEVFSSMAIMQLREETGVAVETAVLVVPEFLYMHCRAVDGVVYPASAPSVHPDMGVHPARDEL